MLERHTHLYAYIYIKYLQTHISNTYNVCPKILNSHNNKTINIKSTFGLSSSYMIPQAFWRGVMVSGTRMLATEPLVALGCGLVPWIIRLTETSYECSIRL